MKKTIVTLCMSLLLALTGCGIGGIQDVKATTEKLETAEQLEKALGRPTKISGGGVKGFSAETHVYETSDGVATFVIFNGKITMRTYGSKDSK